MILLSVFFAATSVHAGPFDLFGFGSRAISMGGAATATADDYSALFYNPANLVIRRAIHLGADFVTTVPDLDIRTANPGSGIVPVEADSFTGIGLGVLFPLGGKIDYRLAFGLAIHIPTNRLMGVDALDPQIPRWYLWDSLSDKLQILFGLGVRITDWLSIGASAQSLAQIDGPVDVAVDPINERLSERRISVELANTLDLIAGFRIGPFHGLSFGFSWRSDLELEFMLPIALDFGEALDVTLIARGRALYTPHTFSLGLAWDVPDTGLLATVEARYALWSAAPDPALDIALDVTGDLIDSLGLGDALDFVPGPSAFPQLTDTWSAHVGAEVWISEHFVGRAGYNFRPSPLPPQTGPTNYVDNDAHTISAGLGVTYPDPLNLDEHPVTFEVTAAYSILPEVTTAKTSPADPVGDFTHGGGIFTFGATLRHDF